MLHASNLYHETVKRYLHIDTCCMTTLEGCLYTDTCYMTTVERCLHTDICCMTTVEGCLLGVQQYGKKRIAIYCNTANPYCNTYCNMLCSTIPTDMWHTWPLIWNPKGNSRKIVHLHGIPFFQDDKLKCIFLQEQINEQTETD